MMIAIIGLGFVGSALFESFSQKGAQVLGYDCCKESDTFESCLNADIMFLCLPTLYCQETCQYDLSSIHDVCQKLNSHCYSGCVVVKSTVEPETTKFLAKQYSSLSFVHNPEFLTARTAFQDVHSQKHIILGITTTTHPVHTEKLSRIYQQYYPDAKISHCTSTESESCKIFVNSFYAMKVQFFTELYLHCQSTEMCSFDTVRDLMIANDWIHPMHTRIPGPDGEISYGGFCFPKDTHALRSYLSRKSSPHALLDAMITERNSMRKDVMK
jgi:UDPglucose 6-dehydrogenase